MPTGLGNGTTIVFGTSGFTAEIVNVGGSGIAREAIETTHLGTVKAGAGKFGSKTFIPAKNTDPGELRLELHFDEDQRPPVEEDPEQITVTFPLPAGAATPATWVGEGFITSFEWGAPLDDKKTGTAVIKLSGNQTVTPSA